MSAILTYTTDTSLDTIEEDLTFTLAVLKHHPFAASFTADFEAMLTRCDTVALEQRNLRRAIVIAQGGIANADGALDALVEQVDLAVSHLAEKSAGHPTRQLLFAGMRPSDLRRPVLGFELETLRAWPTALESTGYDSLKALVPSATAAIKAADDAVVALAASQEQNRIFRLVGNRKKFIDDVNVLRAKTYGVLSTYAHDHPTEKVPADIASLAFRKSRKSSKATIESLDLDLAAARDSVASLESQRTQLVAEEAAAAKRLADDDARRAAEEIAAAQAAADEALKKLEAAKAKAKGAT